MKYQVPQFIEVEDKIFGPLTFKQFIFLVGGAGICFIAYRMIPFFWAVLLMIPAGGLSIALAFYRPNNRPFIDTIEAAFNFAMTSKLYIWRKEDKKPEAMDPLASLRTSKSSILVPKISNSKLKDLAWSLDINETIYSSDKGQLEGRKNAPTKLSF